MTTPTPIAELRLAGHELGYVGSRIAALHVFR